MARKMKTMDGNHAAAHASYAFSDVAAIYPYLTIIFGRVVSLIRTIR